jgi:hypothetical protein
MATARAALRGAASVNPIEAGVTQAAAVMSAALEVNNAYVTAFHSMFDPGTGELEYVDAGHGHARLLRGSKGQELLGVRSAPIGMLPDTKFVSGKATLGQGDSLVVFLGRPARSAPGPGDQRGPASGRGPASAERPGDGRRPGAGARRQLSTTSPWLSTEAPPAGACRNPRSGQRPSLK